MLILIGVRWHQSVPCASIDVNPGARQAKRGYGAKRVFILDYFFSIRSSLIYL